MRTCATRLFHASVFTVLVCSSTALGQAPPEPTPAPIPEAVPPPRPRERDFWKVNAQAGLIWLSGNSNSLAFSGGAVVVRDDKLNVLTLTARGAYATTADPPADTSPFAKPAASNWLAAVRYDRLFGEPNGEGLRSNNAFFEARVGQDKFAGIWLRPEVNAGVGRYFVRSKVQTFRGEVGANYQHEWAAADPNPLAMPPTNAVDYVAGFEKNYYGGRIGLLYENKITPYASFVDAAEVTVSYSPEKALPTDDAARALFSNVVGLSSMISSRVSLKLQNTTKINSQPPAGKQLWDNTLEVAIAVTVL